MGNSSTAVFVVDEETCYGCGACIALCPTNALLLENRLAIVSQSDCTLCEHCIPSCPVFALSIKEE
ncbi:MAG: 4Fe-4S binding protein [Candidatus Poseidoniaceae archaeon]|jgi:NAD-dependent dihydropyrimidine dehydrogenase PreA subunit|nr:4Fe-4S binding protein [Candidatus Poseidoniaceae archaeon]